MRGDDVAIVDQRECIRGRRLALGREAGDQVGADRQAGPRCLEPFDRSNRIGPAMPPLHPLEDQVVAGLQREVEMWQQARLARDQLHQRIVNLDAVERRQPQPRERGHIG